MTIVFILNGESMNSGLISKFSKNLLPNNVIKQTKLQRIFLRILHTLIFHQLFNKSPAVLWNTERQFWVHNYQPLVLILEN